MDIKAYQSMLRRTIRELSLNAFIFGWGSERVHELVRKRQWERWGVENDLYDQHIPANNSDTLRLADKLFGLKVRAGLAYY